MRESLYYDSTNPSHLGGPSPKENGWIYLGYSCHNLNETKIGNTTRSLYSRIHESTVNPYYTLFAAFHIPPILHNEIESIEKYVKWKCAWNNIPRPTGTPSEWYKNSPQDVLSQMVGRMCNRLPNVLTEDGDFDYTPYIYLPKINPYFFDLNYQDLEKFKRLSAPGIYMEELKHGWTTWPDRPNFINDFETTKISDDLLIAGPNVLKQRINYDAACR